MTDSDERALRWLNAGAAHDGNPAGIRPSYYARSITSTPMSVKAAITRTPRRAVRPKRSTSGRLYYKAVFTSNNLFKKLCSGLADPADNPNQAPITAR